MYRKVVVSACILFILIYTSYGVNHADPEGYYWREYGGNIPGDIIQGGKENGAITYLAKALYKNLYIPGKLLYPNESVVIEWGNEIHYIKNNIMILCTNHIERFFWLTINGANFWNRTEYFVVAARERSNYVYFGRTKHDEDVVAGKIPSDKKKTMLYSEHKGERFQSATYEILMYEPPKETTTEDGSSSSLQETIPKCNCPNKRVAFNFFKC